LSNTNQSPALEGKKLRLRFEHGAPVIDAKLDEVWRPVLDGRPFLTLSVGSKHRAIPIKEWRVNGREAIFLAALKDWEIAGSAQMAGEKAERVDWELEARYGGRRPTAVSFGVTFRVMDQGTPRWMIPGMFYKFNRPAHSVRVYPRYDPAGGNPSEFVSTYWAFRADRSAMPAVFCWTDEVFTAILTSELFSHGMSGLAFRGDGSGTFLRLHFPYREEPVKYSFCDDDGTAPAAAKALVEPGQSVRLVFSLTAGARDLHAYDSCIRDIYSSVREPQRLFAPWMSKDRAMELVAYGLWRWHYDPEHAALYETSAFDSYFGRGRGQFDRTHMHVAWVSGAPYAHFLREYGLQMGNRDYADAGLAVLDKIASEGLAPSGFFYPQWTLEKGWDSGWNPKPNWIHARTAGEATFFYLKALAAEESRKIRHPSWESTAKANLEAALRCQRADGNLGSYYDIETGKVEEWDGAAGLMWIAALVVGAKRFGEARYLKAAECAGEYYRRFVEDEYIYGAPEDVHLTPTSEDGYNAVIAYTELFKATSEQKWLALARRAAEWAMTFRWTYNTTFPKETLLGKYDFRTFGADIASPSNNHLHSYGLVCHPELLALWEETGDVYYLLRARDHLLCFHQFIARCDGDFNARKGMVTEQWFHTDWTHRKGSILQLAHSWCAGLILYADMFTRDFGDIIVDVGSRQVVALEAVRVERVEWRRGVSFEVINPLDEDLELSIRFRKSGKSGSFRVGANGRISIRADEKGVAVR